MHTGRHRMKSHGGLPQGSTCGLGSALEKIVPSAFGDKGGQTPDEIKKES